MRWKRATIFGVTFAGILLLTTVLFSSVNSRNLKWRVALVRSKVAGEVPELSWFDVFIAQYPTRWLTYQRRLAQQVALVVGEQPLLIQRRDFSSPCSALFQTPLGPVWGRFEDGLTLALIIRDIRELGIYEYGEVRISPGDVVVDAGGHLGLFTRLALQRGARLVVAFEPEPVNAACFQKTFAEDIRQGRVRLVQAALWSEPGVLRFAERRDNTAAGRIASDGSLEVPATTLDEAVHALGLERVDFIKMDIEGSERQALLGARRTLRQFAPKLVVCIYHGADDRQAIPRMVREANPDYEMIPGTEQLYARVPAPASRRGRP